MPQHLPRPRVPKWKVLPLTLSLLLPLAAQTKSPLLSGDALIDSRQAEVAQLALLNYNFQVAPGAWTHHQVTICPTFDDLVFARYERTSRDGTLASFLAIYNPAIPPAKSVEKPWQGGILLLPLSGITRDPEPVITRKETRTTFNHLWANELRRTPKISADALGTCYIHLAGEQPVPSPPHPLIDPATHVDSLLIPLTPIASKPRSLAIQIGPDSLLQDVQIIQ